MPSFQDAQRATALDKARRGLQTAYAGAAAALTPLGRVADRAFEAASGVAGRALAGAVVLLLPFALESRSAD